MVKKEAEVFGVKLKTTEYSTRVFERMVAQVNESIALVLKEAGGNKVGGCIFDHIVINELTAFRRNVKLEATGYRILGIDSRGFDGGGWVDFVRQMELVVDYCDLLIGNNELLIKELSTQGTGGSFSVGQRLQKLKGL